MKRRGRTLRRRLLADDEPFFGVMQPRPGCLLATPDVGGIRPGATRPIARMRRGVIGRHVGALPELDSDEPTESEGEWVPPAPGEDTWPWRSPSPGADGFMAPVASASGPLAPNGTGWVLASGGPAVRLFPRATELAARTGPLATMGPVLGSFLFDYPDFASVAALTLLPFGLGVGLVKLCATALLRRQQRRAKATPHLADLPTGSLVRIKGTIAAQPSFPSLFRGRPGVLARSRVGLAEETRGIDFWLEAPEGERVRIFVRDAFLLNRPTLLRDLPVCDPVSCDWWSQPAPRLRPYLPDAQPLYHRLIPPRLYENSVGPGDFVEVCGHLYREAGPEGDAGPGRGTPLYWSLRAVPETPLLVRRLPDH